MIPTIGVLLTLAGFSIFVIGLVRHFFPSTESFFPEDLQRVFTIKIGVYAFLGGIILLRFF